MDTELLNKIEHLYYEEKQSIRKVSATLHISSDTISDYLNNYSAGARGKSEACLLRTTPDYCDKIRVTQLGERNTSAKLTEKIVLRIREEYEELLQDGYGKTDAQRKLARKYTVKRSTISDIVLRRTWKHI